MEPLVCPDCKRTISGRARCCPNCGYQNEAGLPIATRRTSLPRLVEFDDSCSALDRVLLEQELTGTVMGVLKEQWLELQALAPALKNMKDGLIARTQYVADLTDDMRQQLAQGVVRIAKDKEGEFLAELVNVDRGKYQAKLRLKEIIDRPDATSAVMGLQMAMQIHKLLVKMADVQSELQHIGASMEDDRIALAYSAAQQLNQAMLIQDPQVRQAKILQAQSDATLARARLERAFDRTSAELAQPRQSQAELESRAKKAFASLDAVMLATSVEAAGYSILGEPEAALSAIAQHSEFAHARKLNQIDTLRQLNSSGKIDREQQLAAYANFIESVDNAVVEAASSKPVLELESTARFIESQERLGQVAIQAESPEQEVVIEAE